MPISFDEICLECGYRFGEHYGRENYSPCFREGVGAGASSYTGTFFRGSGKVSFIKGKRHFDIMKTVANDPNKAFRFRKQIHG